MSRALRPVHRVAVDTGISIAFWEDGTRGAPSLLLLHAWGESLASFDRLTDGLPDALHVLAVDLRGHGHSDKPLHGYELVTAADDIRAFLDAVGVASAVLVGSSSGGYVAQQVAVSAPDRVRGLVLAGVPLSLAGRPDFADEIDALVDPISPDWARDFVAGFGLESEVPAGYLADRLQDALAIPAAVWRLSLAGLTGSPPPLRTGRITAPTLAIWGDSDPFVTLDDQAALVAGIPGAKGNHFAIGRPGRGLVVLSHIS